MALVRFLAGLAVIVAIAAGGLILLARSSDGPIGVIAGGPFTSGETHSGPEPDWSFVADRETVEFQLLEPARSRTSWILVQGDRVFIPCGYMNSQWGRLWKRWPIEAEQDGRAILRVDQTLYPVRLERIEQGAILEPLIAELNRKYGASASVAAVTSGALWLFELQPSSV